MRLEILDHGYVELVESWGSDERIIEAARMSTSKGFLGWGPIHDPACAGLVWVNAGEAPNRCSCTPTRGDEKLLRYLWENKHATPFEMAGLIVEVQAPIFVFREWHRHRTQSYTELSARYTALPNLFYMPSIERLMSGRQSTTNKQGSQAGVSERDARLIQEGIAKAYDNARDYYETLLAAGVAKELARLVIPVAQYSRMRASANLRNWLAFLTLRQAPGAQWEIRQYADAVARLVGERFPRTHALYAGGAA